MICSVDGVLHEYGAEARELATTHTVLHERGILMAQWLQTAEDNDISVQHYAPREDAYPNMLNGSHNGLN